MTIGGWICMTGAIGFVTIFFAFCVYKMATTKSSEDDSQDADERPKADA